MIEDRWGIRSLDRCWDFVLRVLAVIGWHSVFDTVLQGLHMTSVPLYVLLVGT